ncbi:30S ribosomal protein S11 [Patescibacteria group bacterium]|nr:30S ribosomal protein S11 [Patescibacteria group bacterium]MCG2702429.1 30S ribosomal protein S11 [Candidatus Parcubacteria bacterium]MBU4210331.1 30S ribosomal protein S11 [Patescibacteria group bacterium]MBU4264521.1 30S ribosomal protein S11 [Patescibacteria group bacterium]MBU4390452.1 30S ribosomal protein S11 [Patescibacteria group bacterium]
MITKKTKNKKRKEYKNIAHAKLYIKSSFNNTIVNITDEKGNTICWASSGSVGFSGARKSTPYAATRAIESVLSEGQKYGIKKLSVYIRGPGVGRDAALRLLRGKRDLDIDKISDLTPIPHNGPKPSKRRRT